MKTWACILILLVLFLCCCSLGMAQQEQDCDQLRSKVEQLEKIDIKAMSPSLGQLYRESLLKVYSQFSKCLARDISTTAAMQEAVASTSASPAVDAKLRQLRKERSATDDKILVLRTNLNPPDAPLAADIVNQPGSSNGAANTDGRTNGTAIMGNDAGGAVVPATTKAAPATQDCAPGVAYQDPPSILNDIVQNAAADVVSNKNPQKSVIPQFELLIYTIFDAASPASSKSVRDLEPYRYLGETARTDKQLGASANSNGSVSAIEKPGFAQLLGFAIEHGGIAKSDDGTNLTLSTSLYSLYAMKDGDTAATYDRAGVLNRIGISASFGVDNKTNELANVRRNNLSEWSLKARLFGDRSTRSAGFQKFWDTEISPLIGARLLAITGPLHELSGQIPNFDSFEDKLICLPDIVKARMDQSDYKAAATTDAQRQKMIADVILSHLRANTYEPIKAGNLKLTPDVVTQIETKYLPSLKLALDNLSIGREILKKKLDDLKTGPLGTFAYTNHRIPTGSDYSEAKFLFEQDKSFFRPLKLTANFGLSLYNKPDRSLKQEKLRDIFAALSFEGTSKSPFTEADNQSKITYSFVGRYQRLFENRRMVKRKPDIGVLQFVAEIPLFRGLSLPLSVTYANATEQEKKQGFRFNFGMHLDTDKLFALLKAASSH